MPTPYTCSSVSLFRFHSCFQQIRTWVDEGRFGQIVHGRMPFLKQYQLAPDEWRARTRKRRWWMFHGSRSRTVWTCSVISSGEVNVVSAFYNNATQGTRVEETGGIFMRFDNGAQAFTDLSFSVPAIATLCWNSMGQKALSGFTTTTGWKMKTYFGDERQLVPYTIRAIL